MTIRKVTILCLSLMVISSHCMASGINFKKSPVTTKGDLYTYSSGDSRLGVGSDGQVLSADSSTSTGLRWVTLGSGSGTVTNSGTLTSNAVIIGQGGAIVATITADSTVGHALFSTATSPAFKQIVTGDVGGIVNVAKGGTGIASGTSGGIPFFNSSTSIGSSAALTANAVVIGGGAAVTPATITADSASSGHFLASTASSPAFRQIVTNDLSGVLPIEKGGTGTTAGASGGSPGGSSGQIQFNNSSSFGGASLISTDSNGLRLGIGPGVLSTVSLDVAGSFRTVPFQLTDGSSIALDASRSNFFYVTLAGAPRTLSNPTNSVFGQRILLMVSQDSTGSRKMGFGTAYKFGFDVPSYDASTTAGHKDYIGFICSNPSVPSWDMVSVSRGYK